MSIINNDATNQKTQMNWDDALHDAHCPTCLKRVNWHSPHSKIDSGTSPRHSTELIGDCCGITYSLSSVDQPASDHTQLFGIIQRIDY